MKKFFSLFASAAMAASLLLVAGGCALFGREAEPKDVQQKFLELSSGYESASECVSERAAAIVSVVADFYVRSGDVGLAKSIYSSGVIVNSAGYILLPYAAAYNGGVKAYSVRAVLAPVYDDKEEYTVKEVYSDSESGLALFKFYDRFYYTDENGTAQSGFQVTAEFSGRALQSGAQCFAVGNALGDLYESGCAQTITSGVISDDALEVVGNSENSLYAVLNGQEYAYLLTSAPTTPEMMGGGLFDENGYLIGLLASKLVTDVSGSAQYLERVTLCYNVAILCDFIDRVSDSLELVIPYTLASEAQR